MPTKRHTGMTRYALIISAFLLAGCASGTPGAAPSTPATSTPATTPPTLEPTMPSAAPPSGKPSLEPQPQGEITVVGVVEEGVEHGCKLLRTNSELYQLVGSASPLIQSGAQLRVRGRPNPTLLTTCQQGTPFQVVEVQRA